MHSRYKATRCEWNENDDARWSALPGIMNRGNSKDICASDSISRFPSKNSRWRDGSRPAAETNGERRDEWQRMIGHLPGRVIHLFSNPRDQSSVSQKVIYETPAIRSVTKESSDTFIQETGRKTRNLAVIYGTWNTFITALYLLQTGSSNF